jgi:hypothetical protein
MRNLKGGGKNVQNYIFLIYESLGEKQTCHLLGVMFLEL